MRRFKRIYGMTVLTLFVVVHKPNFRGLFARSDIHRVWLLNGKTFQTETIPNGFHLLTEQTFPLAVALHLERSKMKKSVLLRKMSPVDHCNGCSGMWVFEWRTNSLFQDQIFKEVVWSYRLRCSNAWWWRNLERNVPDWSLFVRSVYILY